MNLLKQAVKKARRFRKWLVAGILMVVVIGASGCRTLSYYAQAARGQYQILSLEQPVEQLLSSSTAPPELKARLRILQDARSYADTELKLPVDGHYRKYADLKRPYVVWNVEAAPEFSMEPKSWWYPLVGRLEYRGYFSEKSAQHYAEALRRKGYDAHVGGATAYSTLGWFKDPALNTFLFLPQVFFIETVFHELAHQRVFASGDKDFNEAFATFVGREGVLRWLRAKDDLQALTNYEANNRHDDSFAQLVIQTRTRLEALFGDVRDKEGKVRAGKDRKLPPLELAEGKWRIIEEMRREYSALRQEWGGDATYDSWFARPINNAKLNSVAAYYEFVPGFARLLQLNGNNLGAFYSAAERLAKMKKAQRHEWLKTLGADTAPRPPARTEPARIGEPRTAAGHPVALPGR